jgi:hypothetical protein
VARLVRRRLPGPVQAVPCSGALRRPRGREDGYTPPDPFDRAAVAYKGPFGDGDLPDEVLTRAAPHMWRGICGARPSTEGGILPGTEALEHIARIYGVPVDSVQASAPHLLGGCKVIRPAGHSPDAVGQGIRRVGVVAASRR